MLGRQGAAKDFALGVRLDTLIEQSLAMFDRDMRYLSVSERWLKDRGGVPPARLRRRGDDRPIDRRDHSAKTAGSAWAWPWCKALSSSMGGGSVEALSPGRGKGSEFIVRLPLGPSQPDASPADQEGPNPLNFHSRVLIVDDDRDVADSLVMLFQYLGAEVRSARDGASGVDEALSFQPDIAFIDLRMPGIDGYETARRIRERLADRAPMLVALTGLGQVQDRQRAEEAGFDLHLTKPASVEDLERVLSLRGPRSIKP